MNTHAPVASARRLSPASARALATAALVAALALALTQGAYPLGIERLLHILGRALLAAPPSPTDAAAVDTEVLLHIRLPRVLLAMVSGAGLALAGALLQGLFRNPLADPGLIGVSSGAAVAAALAIVIGAVWWPEAPRALGSWTLVLWAFGGGVLATAAVHAFARGPDHTRVPTMLLTGIAINALCGAALGLMSYMASDEQLRSLQFWLLGSLGGARWSAVVVVTAVVLLAWVRAWSMAHALDALALGETQASLLGVDIRRLQRHAVWTAALAVGAVTATTGIIGFVGLIAPHLVRLIVGPAHTTLLAHSALVGAALVLLADTAARTLVQPAELPLGVLTALLGGPFFLALLRSRGPRP